MAKCFYADALYLRFECIKDPLILERIYGSVTLLNSQIPIRLEIEKERDSSLHFLKKICHNIVIIQTEIELLKKDGKYTEEIKKEYTEELNMNFQYLD